MKKTDIELLSILKKESKSKTNQELLDVVERLAEIMRAKKAKDVYQSQTRDRLRVGADRFKEAPPEADYLK